MKKILSEVVGLKSCKTKIPEVSGDFPNSITEFIQIYQR